MPARRVICTACANVPAQHKHLCHECKGLGYIEYFDRPPGCTGNQPECPIEYEPAVGGWLCTKCGDSGSL